MSGKIQQLKRTVFQSPALKTFFSALSLVATGVLASAFVVEINTPTGLVWSNFYRAKSFYGLFVLFLLLFFYNRALYEFETDVDRFLDKDYCTAYMRSQCLPEAAERYRQAIRTGAIGELERAMDELRRVLQ